MAANGAQKWRTPQCDDGGRWRVAAYLYGMGMGGGMEVPVLECVCVLCVRAICYVYVYGKTGRTPKEILTYA
eukprot:scaffold269_cov123-Isochrysis_galbana.AAC.20